MQEYSRPDQSRNMLSGFSVTGILKDRYFSTAHQVAVSERKEKTRNKRDKRLNMAPVAAG